MKKLTFPITRANLGGYAGGTLGWFIIDADGLEAASSVMEHVADLAAFAVDGDPRGTIDVVIDDTDPAHLLLARDPLSAVPTADTTGSEPAAVVFYDTTGGSDATDKLVSLLQVPELEPGGPGWEVDPADGIADITDQNNLSVATVPFVNGDVDAETLAGVLAAYLSGGPSLPAVMFVEDVDASGGSFTDVVQVGSGAVTPRAYLVGVMVLVVEGDDLGLWTITASGPCTPGPDLVPGQVIAAAPNSQGLVAVGVTGDGSTVSEIVVQATEKFARLQSVDGESALRAVQAGPVTVRQFEACAPWGDDHDAKSWSTPKPASFTDGVWIEALVTVTGEGLPGSPTDRQTVYQEIATQTADGIGVWDAFELAVQSMWSAPLGQWSHTLFWEHTSTGAVSEDFQMSRTAEVWTFTEGVPARVAVWVDFASGTGRLLREAPEGAAGDLSAAGRHWRTIDTKTGPATDIDPSISDDWFIGAGNGSLLVPEVVFRDDGPSGTILASPSAADAFAAGDLAFDDPQANTWTPGPDAATQAGATPPGGVALSDAAPADLGTAAPGAAVEASRADHVHDLPTLAALGAAPSSRTLAGLDLTADRSASALRSAMSLYTQSEVDAAIAAALAAVIPVEVAPSGDLSATSTTTLANWTGFSFAVTAGQTYKFKGRAYYAGDGGDARLGFTAPSGTLRIGGAGLSASATSLPGGVQTSDVIDASGEYLTIGTIATFRHWVQFDGLFICSSSGTLQVQGAQNTSNGTATVFQATGSYLSYTSHPT